MIATIFLCISCFVFGAIMSWLFVDMKYSKYIHFALGILRETEMHCPRCVKLRAKAKELLK